jgi:hypothetical protein
MSVLYLYGLLLERPAGSFRGLRGEPVRFIPALGLQAAAGEMEEVPPVEPEELRAHEAAVRRIWEAAAGLLPVRFGGALKEAGDLEPLLSPRLEALREALALVRGREQMTLRVFGEPEVERLKEAWLEECAASPAPKEPAAAEASGADAGRAERPGPGTRYLLDRRAALEHLGKVPEAEPLRKAIGPLVAAERVERHRKGPLIATIHHLVERGAGAAYAEAVARENSTAASARFRVSGPWPPYAFAPEEP